MKNTVKKLFACLLAALIFASVPLAVSAADDAADTAVNAAGDVQTNKIPLLVIIASFDANGNGFDDFDPDQKDKLYSDTSSQYYGEQWAQTKPSDHFSRFFGETGYTLANYFLEMTCGHVTYVPAVFDDPDPSWDVTSGVIAVTVTMKHPTASKNASGTIQAIVRACDQYINFAKFDKNGDKKIGQNELGLVILNAGCDHSSGTAYENEGNPRGYFSVHGTSQGTNVSMDGVTVASSNGAGNVTNMGEYKSPGTIVSIGVPCHELAHNLGAEDLYNRNSGGGGSADSTWPQPYRFSLQCNGNQIGAGSRLSGTTPAYLDPYQRVLLGWVEEQAVTDGTYTLYSTCSGKYKVLRVNTPDPNEYYLIEIRLKEGFESNLTTGGEGGIMVWHIDESINNKYYAKGDACSSYISSGDTERHDPGIVPLFRTGWNELGTRMITTDPSDPYYYLSSDSSTSVFNSSDYCSPTNGSISLNSYPAGYSGTRTYNLHIEVLSKPGQEMQIKISTENNAKLAPICTVGATASTLNSIDIKCNVLALNGTKLTKYGFIYSTDSNPTLENGKYVDGVSASDGTSFTALINGLKADTKYYFVACASNEYLDGTSNVSYTFTEKQSVEKDYFLVKMYKNLTSPQRATEVKVKLGETLSYSFPMVKEGYILEGWYLDGNFTEKYDMNHTESSYTTITLYAHWVEGTEETTAVTTATEAAGTTAGTESSAETTATAASSSESDVQTSTSDDGKPDKKSGNTSLVIVIVAVALIALAAAAYYFFVIVKKKQK